MGYALKKIVYRLLSMKADYAMPLNSLPFVSYYERAIIYRPDILRVYSGGLIIKNIMVVYC